MVLHFSHLIKASVCFALLTSSCTSSKNAHPHNHEHDENGKCRYKHDYSKLKALAKMCGRYKRDLKNTLIAGDGEKDVCCIKKEGIVVSFCSITALVDTAVGYIVKEPDFTLY